jgi:hypothetical protein
MASTVIDPELRSADATLKHLRTENDNLREQVDRLEENLATMHSEYERLTRPERADGVLLRRTIAAVHATSVNRFEVLLDWPECHKRGCQAHHPGPSAALTTMMLTISDNVRAELIAHAITRPDVAEDGDSPTMVAAYTLATLLNRYNVHHAGTFVKAAQLIVEAYPALVPALSEVR